LLPRPLFWKNDGSGNFHQAGVPFLVRDDFFQMPTRRHRGLQCVRLYSL
jgi:hypothetical protein